MNVGRMATLAALCLVLGSLFAGTAAHAICDTTPAQPPGTPPFGMNIQGDVAGTKLSGVVEVTFSGLHCTPNPDLVCGVQVWPDLATAKGSLRLRKDNEMYTFYLDMGEVPFDDIAAVQALAMEEFRAPILGAFFGVPQGTNSPLHIYLKEMTQFSVGTIANGNAAQGTYIVDPNGPVGNRIVEFVAVADVTVAVK